MCLDVGMRGGETQRRSAQMNARGGAREDTTCPLTCGKTPAIGAETTTTWNLRLHNQTIDI